MVHRRRQVRLAVGTPGQAAPSDGDLHRLQLLLPPPLQVVPEVARTPHRLLAHILHGSQSEEQRFVVLLIKQRVQTEASVGTEPLVQRQLLRPVLSVASCLRSGEALVEGDPVPSEVLLFNKVHQGDDLLCKSPAVSGGLAVRPRVLQQGQKVEPLAAHVDQVQRELPVRGVAERAAGEGRGLSSAVSKLYDSGFIYSFVQSLSLKKKTSKRRFDV